MTRENLISGERHQKSPTYGHVTKLPVYLESEFQHKGNKQMQKNPANSQQNLTVFSAATDSEHNMSVLITQGGESHGFNDVGCFGFNGPLRQYFSLYGAVSQREGERIDEIKMSKQPQPAPTASAEDPCPNVIQIVGCPGTGSLPSTIAPPDHHWF